MLNRDATLSHVELQLRQVAWTLRATARREGGELLYYNYGVNSKQLITLPHFNTPRPQTRRLRIAAPLSSQMAPESK